LPVEFAQVLLFAVMVELGVAFTVATVEPAAEAQPLTVIVTLYVPLAAVVALAIDGFCELELNPFGPVQLYVALLTVGVLRVKVLPEQIGPPLLAVGVAGTGLMVTFFVPTELHVVAVTVTVHCNATVPLAPAV
jgi:hypothetical protein